MTREGVLTPSIANDDHFCARQVVGTRRAVTAAKAWKLDVSRYKRGPLLFLRTDG